MSDLFSGLILIFIVIILGSVFIWLLPYLIMGGLFIWVTRKLLKFLKSKEVPKEEVEVKVEEDTFDEMKKEAIDVDYQDINKK